MSVSHLLEDFGSFTKSAVIELTETMLEEQRLDAFEKGYQAGWDDSAKASSDSNGKLTADTAQSLTDLSFTYQEAYVGLLTGLRPLIEQIVGAVLPQIASDTLAPRVSELLADLLKTHGKAPVELVVGQGQSSAMEPLLETQTALPLSLKEDASIGPNQVQLRFGNICERDVDLDAVIKAISETVQSFFETETQVEKETA